AGTTVDHPIYGDRIVERRQSATPEGGIISVQTDITERKRAEEEIAEKEAQLRLALDNMPGGMALVDRDLNYVLFNAQYSELYDFPDGLIKVGGSKRDELRFQAERGDYGPGDAAEAMEEILAIYRKGEAARWERTLANGRTLEFHVAPTPEGGYVSIVTDITERKRAEDNLQENRDQLQALADNLPDFISMKDPDGRFVFVNRRFEEWVCVDRNDVIGKSVHDIYPEEQATEFDALDREVLASRKVATREVELSYPDGNTRTIIGIRFPVISSKGEVLGLGTVNHDITERKRAERELAEKEAQLRVALDNMPGGMMLGDRDLNHVLFNSQYSELLEFPDGLVRVGGSSRDELRYQADRGDFGPGNKDELVEQVVATYQSGEAVSYERAIAGSGRTLQVYVAPTPEGGYVTIATDITERKRAEEALREQTSIIELLHKTTADANQAEDAEAAMRACLEAVCAHTGWPVGHVYVRSPEVPDLLVPTDIWHLDQPERFATFRKVTQKTTFEPGVGLPGRALESGKPAWIVDVTKDPNFPRAKLAEEIGVRAGFAVPVLVGNRVEAVLEFFAATAVEPDEALMQVLGNIGAQVGRAVERKRAEAELAEKEAQLRVALDNMPGGMMLRDRDLNYVLFNSQYSELLEFPDGLVRVGGSSRDVWRYQAERGDYGPGDKDELIEQAVARYQRAKP
ncbi:MAG: PAS-domain containing protein, partial [Proteobacteria bacterium]|nr:PAS-domain containing protein [Pseudomonadota bacterium]